MADKLKYPIGIQYFPDVIEGGYVYVDKTAYIAKLTDSGKYYFLSRPRRFGKSLFISTLEAFFQGRRELFRGLAIDSDRYDWTPRPVIKMSLNTVDPKSTEELYNCFDNIFSLHESKYGLQSNTKSLSDRFLNILRSAYEETGQKVAVLIDEYDAPLLSTLDNETLNQSYRATLKSVFSVLKSADEYILFAFITGVSRFSHTSLFSGANNLMDISLEDEYAAICGITESELKDNLMPGVGEFAKKLGISDREMLVSLKSNYDGYHFSADSPDIYNPFSLLKALNSKRITDYWFQSGTPGYLLSVLKRDNFYLPQLDCLEAAESALSAKESYLQNPVALLYETGYVTIKNYDDEAESYLLGLPNHEVSKSFSEVLIPVYSGVEEYECQQSVLLMRKAALNGRPEEFMQRLQTFLEGNPYSNTELKKRETYFKNNIFIILKAMGFRPRVEEETCRARMDVMLRTRRFIYIFELKTDGSTSEAMDQIDDRGYALPYANEGRQIIKIAANYSSPRNNIDSWTIEM